MILNIWPVSLNLPLKSLPIHSHYSIHISSNPRIYSRSFVPRFSYLGEQLYRRPAVRRKFRKNDSRENRMVQIIIRKLL